MYNLSVLTGEIARKLRTKKISCAAVRASDRKHMGFRLTSLRTALLLPSVGLIVFVAITIGLLSYLTGKRAAESFSERLLADTTDRVVDAVASHMALPSLALNVVAPDADSFLPGATGSIDQLAAHSLDGIEKRLWLASGLMPEVSGYVYFGSGDGRFIGVHRGASGAEVRVKTTADGERIAYRSSGPGLRGDELRRDQFVPQDRPWYKAAIARNALLWSPVYVSATSKALTLTLAKPMHDGEGRSHGVVATDLPLQQLAQFVSQLQVSETGVAFIVDERGELVAASKNAALVDRVGGAITRRKAGDSEVAIIRDAYAAYLADSNMPTNALAESVRTRRTSFQSDSGTVDLATTQRSDHPGLNWTIFVAVPRHDHLGQLTHAAYRNALIGVFAVLIALALGLWFARKIATDVGRLSDTTRLLAAGETPTPVHIDRRDELGTIARAMQQLSASLFVDPLTGALNRKTFEQRANTLLASLDYSARQTATLIFVDLNGFKRVNDQHGHAVGDAVLAITAQRLSRVLREGDLIARFGGDEFVLLQQDVSSFDAASAVLQRCREAVSTPIVVAGIETSVTASFGIVRFPKHGATLASLLDFADQAMYRDKAESKQSAV
jgi:diguanylate cyclase (GGDEF)-like protein